MAPSPPHAWPHNSASTMGTACETTRTLPTSIAHIHGGSVQCRFVMQGPRLYALLLDEPRGPKRCLSYRCAEREEVVPVSVQTLPAGTPILLEGVPGAWEHGFDRLPTSWDPPRPTVEELRAGR